jgi:hypothetical protein
MTVFDSMVKILVTYAGKPMSPRYKVLGRSGLEATPAHSDKNGYF